MNRRWELLVILIVAAISATAISHRKPVVKVARPDPPRARRPVSSSDWTPRPSQKSEEVSASQNLTIGGLEPGDSLWKAESRLKRLSVEPYPMALPPGENQGWYAAWQGQTTNTTILFGKDKSIGQIQGAQLELEQSRVLSSGDDGGEVEAALGPPNEAGPNKFGPGTFWHYRFASSELTILFLDDKTHEFTLRHPRFFVPG